MSAATNGSDFEPHTYPGSKYTTSNSEEARAAEKAAPRKRSVGELFATASAQFSQLIRDEINYTKASAIAKVKHLGKGGAALALAGILALYLLGILLLALSAAFAALLHNWWAGFLITAAILLVVIGALVGFGIYAFKKSGKYEVSPSDGISKDIEAVKKGVQE